MGDIDPALAAAWGVYSPLWKPQKGEVMERPYEVWLSEHANYGTQTLYWRIAPKCDATWVTVRVRGDNTCEIYHTLTQDAANILLSYFGLWEVRHEFPIQVLIAKSPFELLRRCRKLEDERNVPIDRRLHPRSIRAGDQIEAAFVC